MQSCIHFQNLTVRIDYNTDINAHHHHYVSFAANDAAVAHESKNVHESMVDSEQDNSRWRAAKINLKYQALIMQERATQPKYSIVKKPGHETAVEEQDLERQEANINPKCPLVAQLNSGKLEACGEWIRTCHSECKICEEERRRPVQIPKVIHFIKDENLTFSDWLAIAASNKYIKPIKINLFTREDVLPNCWMRRLSLIDRVRILKLSEEHWLENLNNVTVAYVEHQSDLLRNAILYHYGGIYMDTDAYATKSFDPLLSNYSVVLGRNLVNKVGNGLIIAQRRSCLICEYASKACNSFDGSWTKHSTISLSNVVNGTSEDSNLLVLNYSSGFFPFSWKKKHFHQLCDMDSSQVPFSLTQVYALHLFGSKFSEQIAERFSDLEWITKTPSVLAAYIRTVINPDVLEPSHLDETLCVDLPSNFIR